MVHRPKIKAPIKIIELPPPLVCLSGFKTTDDLLRRLDLDEVAFPFEKELSLYLLFITSIWPDDEERLVTAARLFGATVTFLTSNKARLANITLISPAALRA